MKAYLDINNAVIKFEENHGVMPNRIILGSQMVHKIRHFEKYTMLWKPVKIDERGRVTFNGIPVETDYERPNAIIVCLIESF